MLVPVTVVKANIALWPTSKELKNLLESFLLAALFMNCLGDSSSPPGLTRPGAIRFSLSNLHCLK